MLRRVVVNIKEFFVHLVYSLSMTHALGFEFGFKC